MSHDSYPEGRPGSDFIGGLNEAIRQNPVPAALVGLGILWLFTGGRNVMLGGASRSLVSSMGHAAHDAGAGAYQGVRDAAGHVADGIQAAKESAAEAGAQVAGAARSAADVMGSAVGRTAHTVSEVASHASDRVWPEGGNAGARTGEPVRSARGGIKGAHEALADLFARQPLLLGAAGAAIGAAIAASLPASHAENRLMGGPADAVKDRAGEFWKETKERGADLAWKGLEQAERQGLTAEAAGAAAKTIVSKVANVAEKAGNDIVDGIRR